MKLRFETILKQVAWSQNKEKPKAASGRGRLEQQIRAKEAMGQRVTYAVGFVLAALSAAFAAYTIDSRSGQNALPSVLPSLAGGVPTNISRGLSTTWNRQRNADPDNTGSVKKSAATAAKADEGKTGEASAQADSKSATAHSYVVRKVVRGAALVEGPEGLQAVIPGVVLPGAGRIMKIEQQDSGWVVVTSETVIKTAPL